MKLTVRDLIEKERQIHKLRFKVLDYEELDLPVEVAIECKDIYIEQLSKLPGVGEKAVNVISKVLDQAAGGVPKKS